MVNIHTGRGREVQRTDRLTNGHTQRQSDGQTVGHTTWQTNKYTDGQTARKKSYEDNTFRQTYTL